MWQTRRDRHIPQVFFHGWIEVPRGFDFAEAPLIVIPCNKLDDVSVQGDTSLGATRVLLREVVNVRLAAVEAWTVLMRPSEVVMYNLGQESEALG